MIHYIIIILILRSFEKHMSFRRAQAMYMPGL